MTGNTSIRIRLSLSVVLLGLMINSPVKANEANDAVELLKLSLSCPNPTVGLESGRHHQDINRFLGNTKTFSLENTRRYGDGKTDTVKFTLNFSKLSRAGELDDAAYIPNLSDGRKASVVALYCVGRDDCVWPDADINYGWIDITVCDEKTADDAKLAINTLIKLNKSGTTKQKRK